MKIRSYSWGSADLSWSVVIEELLHAAEQMGHQVDFISTNGTTGMQYWDEARVSAALASERQMQKNGESYDIDITFTVPNNYAARFLKTSKLKLAITDYESSPAPANWRQWYGIPDFILPGSNWVAGALKAGGCPATKLKVVPHGVDTGIFNSSAIPLPIKTDKAFRFLCVAEPHYRKQIDLLLETYCKTFSSADDVCLVLKTKLFKNGEARKPYEQDIRQVLARLVRQYGAKMPEIKILTTRIPNIASLYTACQAFVLMTAAEGFGVPFLEALACGLIVIAPRFGGQLDFLNDDNALLCNTSWRAARMTEQYWGQSLEARVGAPDPEHFGELMRNVVSDYGSIKEKLAPKGLETAAQFTWKEAMKKIIAMAEAA